MKCEEVKNLIIESASLNELIVKADVEAHLNSCQSCQAKYQFEQKIRSSFLSMAQEPPPSGLAKSIMGIQDVHDTISLWDKIQSFFFSFTFKVSFASCITGFLLALVISHYDHSVIIQENTLLKAERKQTETKSFAMKTRKSKVSLKKLIKLGDTSKENAAVNLIQKTSDETAVYSIADEENNWSKLSEKPMIAKNIEIEVPEASFSIQKSKAENNMQKMELAMAPKRVMSKSLRRARTIVCSEMKVDCEKEQLSSSSLKRSLVDGFSIESNELVVNKDMAIKIEHLISKKNIKVLSGPINIKDWAIQGIITVQDCIEMMPPFGKHWCVEKNGSKIRVFLKDDVESK